MANATFKAQSTATPYTTTGTYRDLASTAQTYHPGTMIALNSSGYATKCDDTAGLRFDGIMDEGRPREVESGGSNGDQKIHVDKPFLFTMKIASAAVTDVGRKVYALYDNEVAFSTSNSVLVGTVHAYVNATTVQIMPYWVSTSGVNAFDGEVLTFTGATGVNEIAVPDNLASALAIVEGSNHYLDFVTTDSAERILASKNLSFVDSVGVMLGTGEDVVISWDGTRLNVTQATANSEIRWGVDGAGIDQRWYGDTASAFMLWDQSADALLLGGAARMFIGDTADANQTIGLCINQGAADDAILTLKSSDVGHGMTTVAETDTYGYFSKGVAAEGGLRVIGLSEAAIGLTLFGYSGADDTTDAPTTTSLAAVHVTGGFANTTGVQAVAAAGNLLNVRNSTNATTFVNEFIVKGDGELYSNQSATVGTFDEHDDAVLCFDLSRALSNEYGDIVRYNEPALVALGILGPPDEQGGRMYSVTKTLMLSICAVAQLGRQIQTIAGHLGLTVAPNGGLLPGGGNLEGVSQQ